MVIHSTNTHLPCTLTTHAQITALLDGAVLLGVGEFRTIFTGKIPVTMDDEVVWPAPPPLKY